MATIGGLEVPEELLVLFRQLVRINDQYRYGSVAKIGHLLSKEKKLNVSTRSLLPQISAMWALITDEQKEEWKRCAVYSAYNPWNLFVQDTAYRLKYGLDGVAVPSPYHQYKVGHLDINAPADEALLAQYHPASYYIQRKVKGTKALYEDVKIEEHLTLPLSLGLSYRSELVATSPEYIAKFYATIYSSYQGRTIETQVGFDLDLETGWQRDVASCADVLGVVRFYDLFIEFVNIRGWFEWDNLEVIHSGSNYGRDWRCSDVNNTLTRVNYQIEKSWEEITLPSGAAFDSVYPQDEPQPTRFYGLAEYAQIP